MQNRTKNVGAVRVRPLQTIIPSLALLFVVALAGSVLKVPTVAAVGDGSAQTLRVTVMDAARNLLAGAKVTATDGDGFNVEATEQSDGVYVIEGVWTKTTLEVDHPRFVLGSFELTLPDQPVVQVEVILGKANPSAVIIDADKLVGFGGGGADIGAPGVVGGQGNPLAGGCPLKCPPDALIEPEACGGDVNGGCNSVPPVFTPASCGDTFCGTAWAEADFRDTDWYLVEHAGGTLSATLTSQFPGVCFIVDLSFPDCFPVVAGDIGCSGECSNIAVASAVLPAGTYVVFVAVGNCDGTGIFDGFPCGGGNNDYVVEINCEGGCQSDDDCPPGEVCLGGICVPSPPENDDCANATRIAVPSFTLGTTTSSTLDGAFPFCGTSITTPGVWYSVMGTGNTITATTCTPFFGYDTKISVYCGSCEEPTCVDGNDDNCVGGGSGLLSTVSWCSQVGAEYLILVHGFGGQTGDFELDLSDDGLNCKATVACLPQGACCLTGLTGECIVTTAAGCDAQGGVYQGDDTDCGGLVYPGFSDCANPFEDISGSGIEAPNASNSDDAGDIVPIGFTFNFYGDDHTNIGVTSNGYLTFGADLTDFSNDAIPNAFDPNDFIAPLWDDFNPSDAGTVHYETKGAAPNRRFIAQWTNVPQFGNNDSNTFQAILFEGSNCIEFRYGSFTPEAFAGDYTIGIENQVGSDGESIPGAEVVPGDCKVICQELVKGPCAPTCPADLVVDGDVGVKDLLFLLGAWGPCPTTCPADLVPDGDVGVKDLLFLLGAWGPCPGPAECKGEVCGKYSFTCHPDDPRCTCFTLFDGSGFCGGSVPCEGLEACPDGNCPPGFVCQVFTCCEGNICVPETSACPLGALANHSLPPGTLTTTGVVGETK